MRRQRNTSCIYTGLVGRKMSVPKPRASRHVIKQKVMLSGGPLDGAQVWLDVDAGVNTLPIAAMKGFPPGRYISTKWNPHEALQNDVPVRVRLAEVL